MVIGWVTKPLTCAMCGKRAVEVLLAGLSLAQAGEMYRVGTIGRVLDGHQMYADLESAGGTALCGASRKE